MRIIALALFTLLSTLSTQASAEDSSKFYQVIERVKATAVNVCGDSDTCLQTGVSLGWFLWNNREKTDIHYNLAKCVGIVAYREGYVFSPMKVLDMKTKDQFVDVSVAICDCVIGYWGKEAICRQALLQRDQESVAKLLNLDNHEAEEVASEQ